MGHKRRDYINCYFLKILGNKIKNFKFRGIKFKLTYLKFLRLESTIYPNKEELRFRTAPTKCEFKNN